MAKTLFFQNCLGVFQGGGCRGAAFVGAYKEAIKRGVSFSEIVGTSAGSIVAVLIAAGASPKQLEVIINNLDFRNFLSEPVDIENYASPKGTKLLLPWKKIYRVLTKLGQYNSTGIEQWLEKELRILLKKDSPIKFNDLIIPTTIVVSDLKSKSVKLYGNSYDPEQEVASAVRKSCNIPFYFQPIEKRYVDGGLLSNLPSFVFSDKQNSIYERVLAFTLNASENNNYEIKTIEDYFKSIVTTTIDGSVNIQMALQKNIHVINIPTGDISATDFNKMTKDKIDFLIENGENEAKKFFDDEIINIKSQNSRFDVFVNYFRAYNEITRSISAGLEEVIISDTSTAWVFDLFPTLIEWVDKKAKITVLFRQNNDDPRHGPFRRRLLIELGCNVQEMENLPIRGIVINANNIANQPYALVFNETIAQELPYHSKMYYGEEDFKVISLLRTACIAGNVFEFPKVSLILKMIHEANLFAALRNVSQYGSDEVYFEIAEIDPTQPIFLTKFVRGFKYRQVEALYKLFENNNVPPFKPAQIEYPSGNHSYFTPPILEHIGDSYYVIEGNTRLTYAYKNRIQKVWCVIVHNVIHPLPSSGKYKVNEILITDQEKLGNTRYEHFNYAYFRSIESAVRPSETTLL